MPTNPTYPGVYIEEIPSGVRTIMGVATSVAAFIGYFKCGPSNKAVQIFNMGDFEREFGGLDKLSEASYAISQFFLNGGTQAWVVRVTSDTAEKAEIPISGTISGPTALTVTAINEGKWGENVYITVDDNTPVSGEFNLSISEYSTSGNRTTITRQEIFLNLSMDTSATNFVQNIINDPNTGSKMVNVIAAGSTAPLANGTLSGTHTTNPDIPVSPDINATITDGTTSTPATPLEVPLSISPGEQSLSDIAPALESAIRTIDPANPAFSSATVTVVNNRLHILAGPGDAKNRITFTSTATSDVLLLTNSTSASENLQEYKLGGGIIANTAQLAGTAGNDGSQPGSTALIGDQTNKKGIYALEDVDFNLLCIPRTAIVGNASGDLTSTQSQAVIAVAEGYCEKRRAFLLVDTPKGYDNPQEIKDWLSANSTLRHRNAALFYPRIRVPDPLNDYRLQDRGASGTIAGLFARTDTSRGVWKSPAGTEAVLRNVSELEDCLTDQQNGSLNPLAINCLRNFPVYGNVCWGARTLDGSDQQASEWKYIPVRRLALFIEESLYRGTKWVVFEPNDEPLWAQIRLNIGAFMHTLFRQAAFQGQTPKEAYFVKCDKETTTQDDINRGVVNIVVGFAPLKPAEFVIIKIQQIAGKIQT